MTTGQPPAEVALEPETVLGDRYRLDQPIGSGGAAVVWVATDEVLDRRVAVKVLRSDPTEDGEAVERFRREATAAAAITHTHSVTVFDVGGHDGRPFLVMELVEGPSLADLIDAKGRVPPALVVEIGRQVAAALGAGHARGLLHRDVTPTNILFTTDGMTKLTDFGIALVAEEVAGSSGADFGTVGYLAPERLDGGEIDARADVFALGAILRECLAGERLDRADEDGTERGADELPPEVPGPLTEVVVRATATDPADRFADGTELAAALEPLGDPELARDALARLVASGIPTAGRLSSRAKTAPLQVDETETVQISAAPPLAPASTEHRAARGQGSTPAEQRVDAIPAVPPTLREPVPEHREDRPATEAPRPTGPRSWLWFGLGLVAVGAIAAAIVGGPDGGVAGTDRGADRGAGGEVPAAGPVPIRAAGDFDPHGDGSEHGDEIAAAFDGDPASAWTTERYNGPDLGGLKPGVGIWFDLGEPRPIRLIELDLTAGGGDVDIYAFKEEPQGDPAAAGPPAARIEGGTGGIRVELEEPLEGRYWLVWFTRVAEGRGGVNEVRFLPR